MTNVYDYRSNGAALCCALIHQHWWTHPLSIVVTYALVVALPGARNGAGRLAKCHSVECQTVWSVYSAVCTGRHMDARQMHAPVDSGCDENVHQMCELSNYGRVPVVTEIMALWLHSGDGRALRIHALLAMWRRTIHTGLSIGREESQGIVSGRPLKTGLPDNHRKRTRRPLLFSVTYDMAIFTISIRCAPPTNQPAS